MVQESGWLFYNLFIEKEILIPLKNDLPRSGGNGRENRPGDDWANRKIETTFQSEVVLTMIYCQ